MIFQVPQGLHKVELITTLEKIPGLIQHLSSTIKNPTAGKTATFNKVETVIQQTKDLMNSIAKLVTTCFICATKVRTAIKPTKQILSKLQMPSKLGGRVFVAIPVTSKRYSIVMIKMKLKAQDKKDMAS